MKQNKFLEMTVLEIVNVMTCGEIKAAISTKHKQEVKEQ